MSLSDYLPGHRIPHFSLGLIALAGLVASLPLPFLAADYFEWETTTLFSVLFLWDGPALAVAGVLLAYVKIWKRNRQGQNTMDVGVPEGFACMFCVPSCLLAGAVLGLTHSFYFASPFLVLAGPPLLLVLALLFINW
jgi:hypothetical protein